MALISVLLPAPLGPTTETICPSSIVERGIPHGRRVAVGDMDVADLKQHGRLPGRR